MSLRKIQSSSSSSFQRRVKVISISERLGDSWSTPIRPTLARITSQKSTYLMRYLVGKLSLPSITNWYGHVALKPSRTI
jgi:hypothetical protein